MKSTDFEACARPYQVRNGRCEKSLRRVLFVAENLTLAQVVRLATLAKSLDTHVYDVHFACNEFDPLVFRGAGFKFWEIRSVEKDEALKRVAKGERVHDERVLTEYVHDELSLLDKVRPDLVVGDFRLSLSTSCTLRNIPLATLINAYWSPYAVRDSFPVPDHPMVKWVGLERAQKYFPQAMPMAFKHFAGPVNSVRKRFGLPAIGSLLEVLTYGDLTLYPDVPELCPTAYLPGNHAYIGYVPWAPEVSDPDALRRSDPRTPWIYVTLGSSGNLDALHAVLKAIGELPVKALLATAGRAAVSELPPNIVTCEFVPGHLAARAASLVITNGGSSTGYQALAEGAPVLGLPSNLDQYLAMTAIENKGAGRLIRSASASVAEVRQGIELLLTRESYRSAARGLSRIFAAYDYRRLFNDRLDDIINRRQTWQSMHGEPIMAGAQ